MARYIIMPEHLHDMDSLDDIVDDPTHYCTLSLWLAQMSPSDFTIQSISHEHNDGGTNCFITNNKSHFIQYIDHPIKVQQLNGHTIEVKGYGLKLVQDPSTLTVIPLWPT